MTLLNSLKWSFFGEIFVKISQPLIFLILAAILTPEDFGLLASALLVTAFSQIFWEAGLNKAIIQRKNNIEEASNFIFITNIVLALFFVILIYFLSDIIATSIFKDIRVANILKLMTIYIFFASCCSVQIALLQKKMNFNKLFWVRVLTSLLPNVLAIPLALNGFSYWSLILTAIFGQFLQFLVLILVHDWRPSLRLNKQVSYEIFSFGKWVLASSFLTWVFIWGDNLVVGYYLDIETFGIYRSGSQFANMFLAILFIPIQPVLYSYLSKQSSHDEIKNISSKIINILSIICIPLAFSLFLVTKEYSNLLFDTKWLGIGLVISSIFLTQGIAWIVGMNGEIYRSIGKPHYELIANFISVFIYIPTYLWAIKYGLEVFLIARILLAFFAVFIHLYVLNLILKKRFIHLAKYLIVLLTLFAFWLILSNYIHHLLSPFGPIINITLIILSASLVIFLFLRYIDKYQTLHEIKSLLLSK